MGLAVVVSRAPVAFGRACALLGPTVDTPLIYIILGWDLQLHPVYCGIKLFELLVLKTSIFNADCMC